MKVSGHLFAELLTAQDVEMQVLDALAAVIAAVGNHAEAVCQTFSKIRLTFALAKFGV